MKKYLLLQMARCDSDNDSGAGPYTDEDQATSPVLAPVQQGRPGGPGRQEMESGPGKNNSEASVADFVRKSGMYWIEEEERRW
jgi:hypothetical protein